MEGISDIRIVGIDEKRPPVIKKAPYIDLVFKLSHQAPADWCSEFNTLLSKHAGSPKINPKEGLYIECWVKTPDEIIGHLESLKQQIKLCNSNYIERIEKSARDTADANASLEHEAGEQGRLNRIIAALNFDDVNPS